MMTFIGMVMDHKPFYKAIKIKAFQLFMKPSFGLVLITGSVSKKVSKLVIALICIVLIPVNCSGAIHIPVNCFLVIVAALDFC